MTGIASSLTSRKASSEPDLTNPALENIYARRSVRNYTDERIPNEVISEIVRAGTYAPSAVNTQPWRFVIIRNREMIQRYGQRAKKNWVAQYKDSTDPHIAPLTRIMSRPEMDIFHGAPVLILVFSSPDAFTGEKDCSLAAENMMLAASSLGVGSCWIGMAMPLGSDSEFLAEVGVPAGHKLVAPLIFGYPAKQDLKAPPRNNDVILKWID